MSKVSATPQDTQPPLSLLSLSIAAANAPPVRHTHPPTHRRLSSAGRSRRRLSDARDAATRPFPTSLQSASASLAALSLSSPTVSHRNVNTAQPTHQTPPTGMSEPELDDTSLFSSPPQSLTKSARKRGTIFTCESCSKVYRHPSCLIKHRWEHTPQWREASKFVLSKHQQVQLLEAAAILSHLSPSSASLPEDRSLWPSFLSGGLVPPPASVPNNDVVLASPSTLHNSHPISSSVPASGSNRTPPTSPRLHDYTISWSSIGIAQVRPGMLGVPTDQRSVPMPVPTSPETTEDDALNLLALRSGSASGFWGGSTLASVSVLSHSRAHSHSHLSSRILRERERRRSNAYEYGSAYTSTPNGGWSLPRSSVRSKSRSSRSQSQSASESRSDDDHDHEDSVDVRVRWEDDTEDGLDRSPIREDMDKVEQGWDGIEMEMEMD